MSETNSVETNQVERIVIRCDKCKFWRLTYEFSNDCTFGDLKSKNHVDDYIGKCHRYPPQIDSVFAGRSEDEGEGGSESMDNCWQQPLTTGHEWCGEFLDV